MNGIVLRAKPIAAFGMIVMVVARCAHPVRAADPAPVALRFCSPVYAAAENSPYALGRQTGLKSAS